VPAGQRSPQGYLTNIIAFQSAEEVFVTLASHELRHVWQWRNRTSARKVRSLLKCNDETEADLYACVSYPAIAHNGWRPRRNKSQGSGCDRERVPPSVAKREDDDALGGSSDRRYHGT
jgi:hypothetical protein